MFNATNYLITIVELKAYIKDAETVFPQDERTELVNFLAEHSELGDIIPGSGGIRKIRWRSRNQGKRGGARVICYFHDLNMPVFLLAVYRKGEKINLTAGELKVLSQLVDSLVSHYLTPKWAKIVCLTNEAS